MPALLFLAAAALSADNSVGFRSPVSTGDYGDAAVPLTWSADQNVAWKTDLPGPGASSPVIFEDRIYLTCATGEVESLSYHVLCFDAKDGSEVWRFTTPQTAFRKPNVGFVALHGFASASTAVDGTGVYASFGPEGVFSLDLEGNERWRAKVGDNTHAFGTAPSPAIAGDVLVVNASVESGRLIGFDKATGEQKWEAGDVKRAWSTPVIVEAGGRTECVLSMEDHLAAYDPATGGELWRVEGVHDYICPSPAVKDGVLYAIGGRKNTATAVKAGPVDGDRVLWRIGEGSNVPSACLVDGLLFWVHQDSGVTTCVDAATGEVNYKKRLDPKPGRTYASPVAANGRVYVVTREAGTYVLPARPEFEILAVNDLGDDSVFNGTPAVYGDALILRSDAALYSIAGD